EHQVAGESRLDGDLGHFKVADFADQNDVGRLTQHGAENLGEREPDALAHLALVNAREIVFDRVLGGDDLAVRAVELIERAVQRRRLTGAGWAGHQKDAVRSLDDPLEDLVVVFLEAHVLDADADRIGAQNTKHDRLAVIRRQRADAEVDVRFVDSQLDAAVLRQALLGDVDARHDLQTRDQRALHAERNAVALDALAVDAITDPYAIFHRLDVNIRSAVADGFGDHRLHQLNDGCLRRVALVGFTCGGKVDRFVDRTVDGLVDGSIQRVFHPVDSLVQRFVDGVGRGCVEHLVEDGLDAAAGGEDGADFLVKTEPQNVQHFQIKRVVYRNAQSPVFRAERHDEVL